MNLAYPYRIDGRGRTAEEPEARWVRGLIEQILFTAPGERVMRPDFGSNVMQLVFAPNSPELAAATQMLLQGALQQWMGDLIELSGLAVESSEASLRITVQYLIRRTRTSQVETFEYGGAAS